MNFDPEITRQMSEFVNASEEKRDYVEAAKVLLKVSGNRVEYKNNLANLDSKKPHILKRLRTYLEFRLAAMTKEQVEAMRKKAEKIIADSDNNLERYRTGKRADHDFLPEEVLAAYKEAADIIQKQKQLHLKIRTLALSDAPCPDSELFPFVKEIIELDKTRLAKWKLYDSYKPAEK